MRIEIATAPDQTNKEKGDLLERFAADFLRTQGYSVETQVRVTAAELDLLCTHRVSGRRLYAECKAHRDPLDANALKNLLGTVALKNYQEGWLISAGPLGKDAKGFQEEWEQKPTDERQRLSIYNPGRVVDALLAASLVKPLPSESEVKAWGRDLRLGEWILLITPYGRFWGAPALSSGVPSSVVVYDAAEGGFVTDHGLLRNLAATDSSLSTLDFDLLARPKTRGGVEPIPTGPDKVVQVQHGDSWADYRPARPEDFVGREDAQTRVLTLLEAVRKKESSTRVFAITGDSGMGKSSLIAKLRRKAAGLRNRRKFHVYAVDARAATNATYVLSAALAGMRSAADAGFGNMEGGEIEITDHADPLESASVRGLLASLEAEQQVLCIVFDQFEELYSKPELFPVFEEAQRLFLSAVSGMSNLVLGFAWRTDSSVQQDHPAYYMWHRLADHRMEVRIGPFTHSESSRAMTVFEKALGEKVRPEMRRQLVESSQGYPWLLKKLCIHVYEQISSGVRQADLLETLDVASLFDHDLQQLTQREQACLRLIAKSAPADWYETLEAAGAEVLRALQDKRLIVRSGDRINLYWDVFREYVLNRTVPSIPFTYVPSSPSLKSLLRVAQALSKDEGRTLAQLTQVSGLGEKTVANVIRDLRMFGIAAGHLSAPLLDPEMPAATAESVLQRIRHVLSRHALTLRLSKMEPGARIGFDDMIAILKSANPAATHRMRTWRVYAERMGQWLCAAGLLVPAGKEGWIRQDTAAVSLPQQQDQRGARGPFMGEAPPRRVLEAAYWLAGRDSVSREDVKGAGHRNAFRVLSRFGIVRSTGDGAFPAARTLGSEADIVQAVWEGARNDSTLSEVVRFLEEHPTAHGEALGNMLEQLHKQQWSRGSRVRIGNGLKRWATWLLSARGPGEIPTPPPSQRRVGKRHRGQKQLFE